MTDRPSDDDESTTGRRAGGDGGPLSPPSVGGESVEGIQPTDTEGAPERGPVIVGSAQATGIGTLTDEPPVFGAGDSGLSGGKRRIGDRIFVGLAGGAGAFVVILVLLVGVFLIVEAVPAISKDKVNFLTSDKFNVTPGDYTFGVAGLLWTTVIISIIAMLLAIPISMGIALFMTQYVPKQFSRPIAYIIDLLAAIPSIVYGIWGVTVLSPKLEVVQRALYHLGGFPLFKDNNYTTGTIFDGGIVLAVMVLPITTAISRDVFERTPRQNIEAALALGATRWEMIRMSVIPYGRAGVVSGSMLGLGRALGETIAVTLILSSLSGSGKFSFSIFSGGSTFASLIANSAGEFETDPGPYIAAGLVLFILTFIVNAAARAVVNRKGF